ALETEVTRAVHDAHAAAAERLLDAVMKNGLPGGWLRDVGHGPAYGGPVEHACPRMCSEQRLQLGDHRGVATRRLGEESASRLGGQVGRLVEDLANAIPVRRRERWRRLIARCRLEYARDPALERLDERRTRCAHAFSSRCSHARASVQSRAAVARAMPSASAVSSSVRPAKNRHSTTRA